MFIITDKNNLVLNYGKQVEIKPGTEYIWFIEENVCYTPKDKILYDTDAVLPEDILPIKYCYTKEAGFYPNPDYHELTVYDRVNPDDVSEIKADYTKELMNEGTI